MIYLDTHVVLWLYAGASEAFPARARLEIERNELRVSPMVVLEAGYLFELGRIGEPPEKVIADLGHRLGLSVCDQPFAAVVDRGLGQRWTRDPFDRLIVAQAGLTSSLLLTRDRSIRRHYRRAVWD